MRVQAIVCQTLCRTTDGKGRVAAVEVMINSLLISDLIFKGEVHEIKEIIAKSRELGIAYGLGSLTASKGGQLAFNIGGSFTVGGELTVVGLVSGAKGDEKITLKLPTEFTLLEGALTQPVPAGEKGEDGKIRASPVTWRIKANAHGPFPIRVELSSGPSQVKRVVIHKNLIF